MKLFKKAKKNNKAVIESIYTKDGRVYASCRKGSVTAELDLCRVPKICDTCPKAAENSRKLKEAFYNEMDRDWIKLQKELRDEGYEVYRAVVEETSKVCEKCTLNKDDFEIKFRVHEVDDAGYAEYMFINKETGEQVTDWRALVY